MKTALLALLCVILALLPTCSGVSECTFSENPDAIENAAKSVLILAVFDKNNEILGSGSGFIAFNKQTLVTNYHVIEDADFIMAIDEDDNIYEVDRIIGFDEKKDIAILTLAGNSALTPLELAESRDLKRGQQVLTIGSPEGLKNSVSSGIISAIYDLNETPDLQFTAPISHGSSGGALFDNSGMVIGITTASYLKGQNINFAVSISHVVDLYSKYEPYYASIQARKTKRPEVRPQPTQTTPKPTLKPSPTPLQTASPLSKISPEEIVKYKTLKVGTRDPAVARLKERMYELGYFARKIVNNLFTETTAEYVKEFQRANGLKVDGVASPEMQALFFSEYAIPKGAAPTPTPKPKAPTNLRVKTASGQAELSWTKVNGASGYRVYRAFSANGTYALVGETAGTTYTDKASVRGNTYYYRVAARFSDNLYSDKSGYIRAVMPKPTTPPYVEPKYPIDFGNSGYVGTSRDPYLDPKIVNISKTKTVDGFTLNYYCTDVYGSKLYFDSGNSYTSEYTYTTRISPGRAVYPGKVSLSLYGSGIRRVYVAISKIHTTDGKTYIVPESQLNYYYWELD